METRVLSSAIEAIGQTPLVELSRITNGLDGRILAKLEYLNPGFSKKDRIARQMIEDAEAQGALSPGQTVVVLLNDSGLKYLSTDLWKTGRLEGWKAVAAISQQTDSPADRTMTGSLAIRSRDFAIARLSRGRGAIGNRGYNSKRNPTGQWSLPMTSGRMVASVTRSKTSSATKK